MGIGTNYSRVEFFLFTENNFTKNMGPFYELQPGLGLGVSPL
jgi:hypothetical protein